MKASEWIDRAKAVNGWESDYRAAKELGITRGGMSQIRTGDSATLRDETIMRVAQAIGEDPAVILADQAMERAKSADVRSAWAGVLQRLGGVAAGLMAAVGVYPALLDGVGHLCALCKPEEAPAKAARRRRPPSPMASMAATLSHTPARA